MRRIVLLTLIVGGLAGQWTWADETTDAINALKKQIEELDQKVRILERQHELDVEAAKAAETAKAADDKKAAEAKPKEVPQIVVGSGGLVVTGVGTNFAFGLHGLLQVDSHTFFNDGGISGNDSIILRRARPIFSGTLYHDFDFLFTPDFGGSSVQIFDAYLNYRYKPWLQLRGGKFKPPEGMEQMQSDSVTMFSERGFVTQLMPTRDLGFQLWGDIYDGVLSYSAGVFNGVGDARTSSTIDFEDHRDVVGRIVIQPFRKTDMKALKGLMFSVGGTYGNVSSNAAGLPSTTGGTLPGYYTADGMQQFFAYTNTTVANGNHWRLSPGAAYYFGPFNLLGEYSISDQRVSRTVAPFAPTTLRNTAWQVGGGWVLTGEDATYSSGITPKWPFDPSAGHWGALQLVGRYGELDIDNDAFPLYSNPAVSASAAHAWGVGLNWFLNRNLRFNASYARTTFVGGSGSGSTATSPPGNVTRQPEEVVTTRVQLAF
jgi:phosphate-selective porin OprO and OprP